MLPQDGAKGAQGQKRKLGTSLSRLDVRDLVISPRGTLEMSSTVSDEWLGMDGSCQALRLG